jgi:transcriptional regulator with XRE-family HTH domain
MEFKERLYELRTQRGLTQEKLAESLYVSRTAISKWESGRGYPSIDSLKAIARFFSITIDELLSEEEILVSNTEERREKKTDDFIFGFLDCSIAIVLLMPIFGQRANGTVLGASLLALTGIQPYLKLIYFLFMIGTVVSGVVTLMLQNCTDALWVKSKKQLSFSLSVVGALVFMMSRQPYAAIFTFVVLLIKARILIRHE